MSNQSKLAIVYVTYDGAVNSASGVGVLSQYFIQAMPQVVGRMSDELPDDTSFHVIAVNLNENADGYSEEIKKSTESICAGLGGKLHLINNGMNGEKGYGGPANWAHASYEASAAIQSIAARHDRTIAYLIDTPFMGLPAYFSSPDNEGSISFVIVPHSDTFTHFPDQKNIERLGWEAVGIHSSNVLDGVYVAKTSEFMLSTLRTHYAINPDRVIPLQTGLMLDSERFRPCDKDEIEAALSHYDIPLERELIFSVGRAVPYKGFENLLKAFAKLSRRYQQAHLVFIAPPHKNETGMTDELLALIKELEIEGKCTPIFELDMLLPQQIYQWPRTRIVAQLSHREPFGLVPEEARICAHEDGPVVVASNLDGFQEQITDTADGFLVNPADTDAVAGTFQNILRLDGSERKAIVSRGRARARRNYDYVESVIGSVHEILSRELGR